MANSLITIPAAPGTNLQSFQNTVSGNVVQAEAVTLVDSTGTEKGVSANPIKTDGSGVTQPVSGTVSVSGSVAVTAATLPFASGNGSLLSGQGSVTGTAAALPSNACKKVTLKANTANTITIYIGPTGVTTSTGLALDPGESVVIEVSNTNLIFTVASTTGAGYSWIAVN